MFELEELLEFGEADYLLIRISTAVTDQFQLLLFCRAGSIALNPKWATLGGKT